ncbi:Type IV pilus biogenesis factor PilY1 [Cupriavidus laharis]|uniref:Type IV pilus biogenesis factor PilY1 n=1 Tax=Cupriavidus laharis TaxID=151654 RepID=A0ABN7YPC1_9BURK|nr:PilC/PilY family type IV pilus protein [Cupriavidus laharis]CAG9175324.1 Type IV pilus biogenesis factor PilY1 [Cupriavidus laharis]
MTGYTKAFRKAVAAALAGLMALSPVSTSLAAVSQQPLIFATSIAPNVMFTLDDSGSMMFEITPESLSPNGTETSWDLTPTRGSWLIYTFPLPSGGRVYSSNGSYYQDDNASVVNFSSGSLAAARYRTAALNVSYYNPDVTYRPWYDPSGNLKNADPAKAYYNPLMTGNGYLDLTQDKTVKTYWLDDDGKGYSYKSVTFYPALYYRYDTSLSGCNNSTSSLKCFRRVEIRTNATYPQSGKRTDCAAAGYCTYSEEIQNFANWFQYYRSRILAMRAAVGQAFSSQNESIRVGYTTINDGTRSGTGSYAGIKRPVAAFDTSSKSAFYQDFYSLDITANGTPLLGAMDTVGKYFKSNAQPWMESAGRPESACRASYHILSTDGYYTDNTDVGDVDSTKGSSIAPVSGTAYQYSPKNPYKDGYSNTLADVAMKYWVNDLRNTENRVPTNARDEAFWQHLVTFTLGVGVKGTLESAPANQPANPDTPRADVLSSILDKLKAGTLSWPKASTSDQTKIDDLWHAAVNSRGDNYSAGDASGLTAALTNALSQIASRSGSSSSAATNSTTLNTDTALFLTRFRSGAWTGELLSQSYNPGDQAFTTLNWNAYQNVPAAASRKIYTWSPGGTTPVGKPLTWSSDTDTSLSSTQKTALGGDKAIVAYLRGDTTLEKRNGGKYRDRVTDNGRGVLVSNVLGDIVNSSPIYVKASDSGYDFLKATEGRSYFSFLANNRVNRRAMIYVGANDGMLHGFDALTGVETFAYMPNQAIVGSNAVKALASPDYIHRFFVDATPAAGDAYFQRTGETAASWRTVLIGGMGAGGKAMFALDVTDPANFDASKVMWEISADTETDLGYTIGTPVIGRLNSGKWVAIFGNGYESASGKAVLYVVDLANPSGTGGIRKIYADPKETAATGNGNGLGSPEVVYDNNLTIQAAYAGDLKGRMWKFDLSDTNPTAWAARMGTTPGVPLFTAVDGVNTTPQAQPITAAPTALINPKDPNKGFLLTFGTGRFYDTADSGATGYNSVYGVWDDQATSVTRSMLQSQTLALATITVGDTPRTLYTLSGNTVDYTRQKGWRIDLLTQGERVVVKPKVDAERLVITTLTPSTDECVGGISSTLLDFSALHGSALSYSVLDVNSDGKIDASDKVTGANNKVLVVSGVSQQGNFGSTIFLGGGEGNKHLKVASATTGEVISVVEQGNIARNRLSWRQISQ